jgi:hypothetical protein
MSLLATFSADIHASHQTGAAPILKARVSARMDAAMSANASATATLNLGNGALGLTALAGATTNVTAAAALTSTSTFLSDTRAAINAGVDVTLALGLGVGSTIPNLNVSATLTALLAAEGEIRFTSDAVVRAAAPLLDGLIAATIRADQNGFDWNVGVALPFASDVALAGSISGDLAGARQVSTTLGWAYRRETGP